VQQEADAPPLLELPDIMVSKLIVLINTYKSVFSTSIGLQPSCAHDHFIPLLDSSKPVKEKPYQYPHSQKEKIEKMVRDMLREGIIQPSKSPFSSLILLVRKKDGN